VLTRQTTDKAMGMLVRRFPAVVPGGGVGGDEGVFRRGRGVDGHGSAISE
jgi:hypothetical protein